MLNVGVGGIAGVAVAEGVNVLLGVADAANVGVGVAAVGRVPLGVFTGGSVLVTVALGGEVSVAVGAAARVAVGGGVGRSAPGAPARIQARMLSIWGADIGGAPSGIALPSPVPGCMSLISKKL